MLPNDASKIPTYFPKTDVASLEQTLVNLANFPMQNQRFFAGNFLAKFCFGFGLVLLAVPGWSWLALAAFCWPRLLLDAPAFRKASWFASGALLACETL